MGQFKNLVAAQSFMHNCSNSQNNDFDLKYACFVPECCRLQDIPRTKYSLQTLCALCCELCAPVDEECPIMVSHGFSSAGGYACLTVMQMTAGEPRFALAVQGCLVSCVCHMMSSILVLFSIFNWRELHCQGVFAMTLHRVSKLFT